MNGQSNTLSTLINTYSIPLSLLAVGAFLLMFLFMVDTLTASFRSLNKAKRIISSREETFNKLEAQTNAITNHASSYANTLGGEGAKLLAELRNLVEEQKMILSTLDMATKDWDIEEIMRIEEETDVSDKDAYISKLKRADIIINYISSKIMEASITSTKLNIPKIRKQQSTVEAFSEAGLFSIKGDEQ